MTGNEREWVTTRGLPSRTQPQTGLTTRGWTPVRFLLQLEYRVEEDWLMVARFEHDAERPRDRNIEMVGLQLDMHHPNGQQLAKRQDWAPMPAVEAMETPRTIFERTPTD